MKYQGLCAGTYAGKSLTPAGDRCKNLYPETLKGAASPEAEKVLLNTPGTTNFTNLGQGGVYYLYTEPTTSRMFAIANNILFELSPVAGVFSNRGAVGFGQFKMSSNGKQIMISCSGSQTGYIFTLATNVLAQITAAGFLGTTDNAFIDGYFISCFGNKIQISGLYDGTTWDALDYTVIEGGSEGISGLLADHGELWVFCFQHTELYQNTGNAAFPFERIRSIYIPYGMPANSRCYVAIDNGVFWLGQSENGQCRVFRADGYVAKGVSNRSIETFFNLYAQDNQGSASATMYGYQNESGHTFLVLNFPLATSDLSPSGGTLSSAINGAQWVYDVTENEWHERMIISGGKESIPNTGVHTYYNGKHYVGGGPGTSSTWILTLSESVYTDNGVVIKRVRRAPHITNGLKWITYHFLRLSAQVGAVQVGAADTMIYLRVSNDGGATWSSSYPKSLGVIGENKKEICWRQLGRAKRRVFEFTTSVIAPVCIIDADLGVEGEQ